MANPIQLIVGLANPGAEYAKTRHNAGAWLVEKFAAQQHANLVLEKKFHGLGGKLTLDGIEHRLLIPTTYMNDSGRAVQAVANFYRIAPEAILVIHDELDLPAGELRVKQGGGDGGHNGLRSVTAHLNTNNYWRLRIGIGHPGQRDQVLDYVLGKPSKEDQEKIFAVIDNALDVLPQFISGEQQKAIQLLHTK